MQLEVLCVCVCVCVYVCVCVCVCLCKIAHSLIRSVFYVLNFVLPMYGPNFAKLPSHSKESRGLVGLFIPSYLMDTANGLLSTPMSSE